MKIHEHYKLLRTQLNDIFDEQVCITELGPTTQGGEVVRGPHIELMIPAEEATIQPEAFQRAADLINEHLCDIKWDGYIKYGEYSGVHNGYYYQMVLDNKS